MWALHHPVRARPRLPLRAVPHGAVHAMLRTRMPGAVLRPGVRRRRVLRLRPQVPLRAVPHGAVQALLWSRMHRAHVLLAGLQGLLLRRPCLRVLRPRLQVSDELLRGGA